MSHGKAISECQPDLNLDLLSIMSLPSGGSPPSLFYEDGLMRKPSNKADIAHVLERDIQSPSTWPIPIHSRSQGIKVIYFSVLVKKLQAVHQPKIFNELGESVVHHLKDVFKKCYYIIGSFDNYDNDKDVKEYERRRRASVLSQANSRPYTVLGGAQIPNWSTFMESSSNKKGLYAFLSEYIDNNRREFGDSVLLILSSAFEDSSITKKIT